TPRLAGEHRLPACSSRQLAANIVANVARVVTCVRQAAERYRQRPVLPRDRACTHNSSARVLRLMKTLLAVLLALATSALAQNPKHPFTFEDMMALKRVGAPVPSPD